MAVSPDGTIALCDESNTITVLHGRADYTLDAYTHGANVTVKHGVNKLAWSPDGTKLVAAGNTVCGRASVYTYDRKTSSLTRLHKIPKDSADADAEGAAAAVGGQSVTDMCTPACTVVSCEDNGCHFSNFTTAPVAWSPGGTLLMIGEMYETESLKT